MGHIDSRLLAVLASTLALLAPAVAEAQPAPSPAAQPAPSPAAQPAAQPEAPAEAQPEAPAEAQPEAPAEAPAGAQPAAPAEAPAGPESPPVVYHSQAEVAVVSGVLDPRSRTGSSMLMLPGSFTLGADLSFLTADAGLDGGEVRFSDVVLFRPRARYTPGERIELFAGTTLLPKQPSFTDELAWQGGHLGVLVHLGERVAGFVQAAGGPLTDRAGWWTGFDLGVQARKRLDDTVVLQGALGGATSLLFFDEDTEAAFWFAEVAAHGEILFQAPHGIAAAWIGVDYRVPVAHAPDSPDPLSGGYLDPQPRVNFHIGGVLSFLDDWDLFAEFVILDRGDIENPATTLPILEGGFDQRHFVFGLLRRFRTDSSPRALLAR